MRSQATWQGRSICEYLAWSLGSKYVSEAESWVLSKGNERSHSASWSRSEYGTEHLDPGPLVCGQAMDVCRGLGWSKMQVPGRDSRRVWVWEAASSLWTVLGLCWKVAVSIDTWSQRFGGEWVLGFHSRTEVQECGMPTVASGRQNSPPSGNRVFCKTGTCTPEPGDSQFLGTQKINLRWQGGTLRKIKVKKGKHQSIVKRQREPRHISQCTKPLCSF